VLSAVPGHPAVVVGLGAAHGFKFAPTFGRLLADLAVDGGTATDLTPFRIDRPALQDSAYRAHWLV
jgi:sarcosine oxidase